VNCVVVFCGRAYFNFSRQSASGFSYLGAMPFTSSGPPTKPAACYRTASRLN
jgi:hypothetical protein